mgnify:CR=1 FL=1
MLHLVLGGARSGKSSFAESWVISEAEIKHVTPFYIATAQAFDEEMDDRILHHQKQRANNNWQLIECPELLTELFESVNKSFDKNDVVLIDCLTLWLTNQLMLGQKLVTEHIEEQTLEPCSNRNKGEGSDKNSVDFLGEYLAEQIQKLVIALENHPATIVMVSNEIGLGVVPMGKATRLFVDHAGWMNQKLAAIAQQVTLVTAGLPLSLKNTAENSEKEEVNRG